MSLGISPTKDNLNISDINGILLNQNNSNSKDSNFNTVLNDEELKLDNSQRILRINYYSLQMLESVNNYANNPVNVQDQTLAKHIEAFKTDAKAVLSEIETDKFTDISQKEGIKDIAGKMNAYGKSFSEVVYTLTENLPAISSETGDRAKTINTKLKALEEKLGDITNTVTQNTFAKEFESLAKSFGISNQYLNDPRLLSLQLTERFTSTLMNSVNSNGDDEETESSADPFGLNASTQQTSGIPFNPSSMSPTQLAQSGLDPSAITQFQSPL